MPEDPTCLPCGVFRHVSPLSQASGPWGVPRLSRAPSRAVTVRRHRLRTDLARRVQNRHVMAVDHLPALPAGEKQDADDHERENQAPRFYCGFSALTVPEQKIDNRNDDCDEITGHVIPGIVQCPDSRLAEEVGKPNHSSEKCHHDTCTDQPHRDSRPEAVARSNEREVGDQRSD